MRASLLLAPALFLGCASPAPTSIDGAVRVIFDADMDSDCDDVGALALLHALADRGEARILATMSSSRNEFTPLCMSAINGWYGRPEIPIGVPKGPGASRKSKYAGEIARRFPHALASPDRAPDAARLYRDLLREQPDGSVVVVTTGYLTNLSDLLRLPAEGDRPSGIDLARSKVRLWACMGGNFVGEPPHDDLTLTNNNFTVEPQGALYAVRNWPGPVVFVGREIGSVPSGLKAGARLAGLPEDNPVRLAYQLYFGGVPKDRHVADQTAVLFAVRGLRDYWKVRTDGVMDLHPDVTFDWRPDPNSRQGFLLKRNPADPSDDRRIEREIEDLMLQPPRSR